MSAEAKKQNLVISRVFDVPLEAVWDAWRDPEKVTGWWGPEHFTCPSAEIDFRVGGTSLVCMRAPQDFGGQDMYSTWAYENIVPMEQIVYVHNLADENGHKVDPAALGMPPDFPVDQRHRIEFKHLGENRTELVITEYGWTVGQMMEMS